MEYRVNNLRIWVEDSYQELSQKAAQIISSQISAKPHTVLGLATGSTPIGTYQELIQLYQAGLVDFAKVTTFNLDEYYQISKSNDQSYDYYMKEQLFNHLNIPSQNIYIPNGEATDYAAECLNYEAKMAAQGGIDLQLLGIGNNGHIGFNEPGSTFTAATHYVALDDSTIAANARFFTSMAEVPKHALTVGIRAIMTAKKVLLLASGPGKAEIIYQTIFGPITPQTPSSILQLHPEVIIIVDQEAGQLVVDNKTEL